MVALLLSGQSVINFIHLVVIEKADIKILMGKNLKRVRLERGLTQDKLGGMLKPEPVDGSHIAAIEGGKGVSDDMLARLCNALKVDLWEFTWTDKTPK
jgi:transcriptional regulator with XRE-family HTH domain